MSRSNRSSFALAALAALLCLPSSGAFALEGIGYGGNVSEARQRAAADLAASIQVRVHSVVESCKEVSGKKVVDCGSRVLNRTASELPLLGLRYQTAPGGDEPQGARAIIDTDAASPLYREKIAALTKDFAAGQAALGTTRERRARHNLLTRQLATLRALSEHRLVAIAIGMTVDELPASETALSEERESLEDTADSIAFAAQLLTKDLDGRLDGVEPFAATGSREATPFGGAIADALRAAMGTRAGQPLRLAGEYRRLDNGDLDLMLEARKAATGELVAVRGTRLAKAGYAGYRAEPLAPDFERLLREGVAVSGDLRAELVTSLGARNLLFKRGDEVQLVARLNRPGYFYVVGHVVRDGDQFSYLLPLQDTGAAGNRDARFVRHVPADQANHYIELGRFEVVAPYGTEHLQIVAGTQRPGDQLPETQHDAETGYDVIRGSRGNARSGLATTRGLKLKADTKAQVAEGTLTFTTRER